jgi:hypothetical protein
MAARANVAVTADPMNHALSEQLQRRPCDAPVSPSQGASQKRRGKLDGFAFCGINSSLHLWENIRTENLKEKANRYRSTAIPCSNGGIPCFCKTHSLFRAEQGIICNKLELHRKLASEPGGKFRKCRKLQKFPVIFPAIREKEEKPYDAGLILIDRAAPLVTTSVPAHDPLPPSRRTASRRP